MKKKGLYIVCTWFIICCFAAGQVMMYAHQHLTKLSLYQTTKTNKGQTIVAEKCSLCDAIHHNNLAVFSYGSFSPLSIKHYSYKLDIYEFSTNIVTATIGRAPPIS